MSMTVRVGTLTQPTSTGVTSEYSLGFQPTVIFFSSSCQTASGVSSTGGLVWGVWTSSSSVCISNSFDNTPFSANPYSARTNTNPLLIHTHSSAGVQTVKFNASLAATSNGFTLNVSTTDGIQRIINYMAFGGTFEVELNSFNTPTSGAGSDFDYVTTLRPDHLIWFGGGFNPVSATTSNDANFHFGQATRENNIPDISVTKQRTSWMLGRSANPTDSARSQSPASNTRAFYAGRTTSANDFFGYLNSLDSLGFNIHWTTLPVNPFRIYYVNFQDLAADIDFIQAPTSTGIFKSTDQMTVSADALMMVHCGRALGPAVLADSEWSIGFYDRTNSTYCYAGSNDGEFITPNHDFAQATDTSIKSYNVGIPTLFCEATFAGFGGDNKLTFNFTTVNATRHQLIFNVFSGAYRRQHINENCVL